MRALLPILATLPLLLAGCIGSDSPPEPVAPAREASPEPEVEAPAFSMVPNVAVFPFAGHLTAAAGAQGVGYVSPTGAEDAHAWAFPTVAGFTGIVVELRWADATQDLDLMLGAPDCDAVQGTGTCIFADGGAPAAGDSPVRLVITEATLLEQAGDWSLAVWAKNAVNLDFEAVATVFYDAPPGEDYSAFVSP